jgi:ABC-type branched-subunit amino acid transport system ATPase component
MGIAHVPEGRKLFTTLTVLENLEMGAYTKRARAQVPETLERVYGLFPILKDRLTRWQARCQVASSKCVPLRVGSWPSHGC